MIFGGIFGIVTVTICNGLKKRENEVKIYNWYELKRTGDGNSDLSLRRKKGYKEIDNSRIQLYENQPFRTARG